MLLLHAVLFFVIRKGRMERTSPSFCFLILCSSKREIAVAENPRRIAYLTGILYCRTCLIMVNRLLTPSSPGPRAARPLGSGEATGLDSNYCSCEQQYCPNDFLKGYRFLRRFKQPKMTYYHRHYNLASYYKNKEPSCSYFWNKKSGSQNH